MKRILTFFKTCFYFVAIYTAITVFVILFFRIINPQATAFIYMNEDSSLETLFKSDYVMKPVSIQNTSKYLPLAAIASEDQMFFDHYGFDFNQIEKAMKENKYRKRIRGASTISMQLAKNLFLNNTKLIIRKGFEAYYTLLLETLWSKERIMEVYLNVAEMGNGIYGVEAASQKYFGSPSLKLNPTQAATLIAILPNPKVRNPQKPTSYLIGRRNHILEQMNLIGGVGILKEGISY